MKMSHAMIASADLLELILQAKSSKPLYGSPLFTARSQLKLDIERRLSNDASPAAAPAKAPPRKQPSSSRLAPPYAPQGGQPQQQMGQPQQLVEMTPTLPVTMTPALPPPWGVLPSSAPQLMPPVPPSAMQLPVTMATVPRGGPQMALYGALPADVLKPAVPSRSPDRQQQQQQRVLQQGSHQNSPAQLPPHEQKPKQPLLQPQQLQRPPQQQQQQPQQTAVGFVPVSPAPWMQQSGLQTGPASKAMTMSQPQQLANDMTLQQNSGQPMGAPWPPQPAAVLPPGQPRQMPMQTVQPQPWTPQQQPSRQASPAPRAKPQSSGGRGVMYGRTVSMGGAAQTRSRAPSTAGSARGSPTGGGSGGFGREWNPHTKQKTIRRKTAVIDPPRQTQTYAERLKVVRGMFFFFCL